MNEDAALELYANIKRRIGALADDNAALIEETDKFFAEYNAPACFDANSPDNAAMAVDKTFEGLCAVLESNGVANAASMTVRQFYSRLDYYKRQNQALQQAMKKPA